MGNSIFVSNNDVYIAGYEDGRAKYWKNGEGIYLDEGAEATSIFVLGNDVYVAGYSKDVKYVYTTAIYWKNGIAVNLTDGTYSAFARSIFVVEEK
jgi:hypothetical protein